MPAATLRNKLMSMIMLTSGAVLLVAAVSFFIYEYLTFRQSSVRNLQTLGGLTATNSTAALAFRNTEDARSILSALRVERHILAAALYDEQGAPFVTYPSSLLPGAVPQNPGELGYRIDKSRVVVVLPVAEGDRRLGTLFLTSDLKVPMLERFRRYGAISTLVIAVAAVIAYLISRVLQRQISQPILSLAETARAISVRRDYSVRAATTGAQELGLLTDAFNHMLTQIQQQTVALEESAVRVRAVIDSAMSAVIVIDSDEKIIDWNERAAAIFGWSRAEALGRDLDLTIIPPHLREAHRAGLQRFLNTGVSKVMNRMLEMTALRRDGSEFPVELSISPMKTGTSITFCGFVTDITARREARLRLQAQLGRLNLLHHITRAIAERQDLQSIFQVVLQNLEDNMPIEFGCVCLYGTATEALTVTTVGARSRERAAALDMADQMRVPIDENGLALCVSGQLVYEPDIQKRQFPFAQRVASGGLRSVVIAPLIVESRVFGVLFAAREAPNAFSSADCEFIKQLSEHVALATHQAQLYTALQQAYDDLRQTQHTVMQQERLRALGQIASGIAHDINNAISPVTLYTESLLEREQNLSERARSYLTTIQRAIEDVASTVARMREFYRQREPQLMLARIDLNRIVGEVVELTHARWSDLPQQRGIFIDLRKELEPDLPNIMGAESEIRDALTNLIFNAVDAMPEGGTLTIRTRAISKAASDSSNAETMQLAAVEVSDTGVGMSEETRRRCLEPFFTTKGERGTGLGLAMVYGMVQRHSAELEIDSEVGKGTTIRLIFPVHVPDLTSTVRLAKPQIPGKRLRILLVDDDPLLIKSLQDTLEMDGHRVTAANGGQAGIEAFASSCESDDHFDIVVTDLGMPYVDGRKVAAAIKAACPEMPVILLTGWGQRLVAEDDVPPHVDRVLNKPPRLPELRAALAELTGTSRAKRELKET